MKKVVILLIALLLIFVPFSGILASSTETAQQIQDRGVTILNAFIWLGYAISLGMVVFIGIKYMLGAADARANMKDAIVKWLIGALIVFMPTVIASTIVNISSNNGSSEDSMTNFISKSIDGSPEYKAISYRNKSDTDASKSFDSSKVTNGSTNMQQTQNNAGNTNSKQPQNDTNKKAVSGVRLNKSVIKLVTGESEKLTATIVPSDATNKKLIWSSDDEKIATISNGTVKAIGTGSTIITVKTVDGEKTASCTVNVNSDEINTDTSNTNVIAVAGISLNKNSITLKVGESEKLKATVKPNNATNKVVIWSSSDSNIATVIDGTVEAVGVGNATISVKPKDGDIITNCDVTIQQGTQYIAHRGANKNGSEKIAPDNTLKAFNLAISNNAYGIETDIYSTKDGKLICFHNTKIIYDTKTNKVLSSKNENSKELSINDTNYSTISKLNIEGEKIPTFEEYLSVCRDGGCTAIIELKSVNNSGINSILSSIKNYGMKNKCMIISFKEEYLKYIRDTKKESIKLCLLISNDSNKNEDGNLKMLKDAINTAKKLGNCAIGPSSGLLMLK